MTSLDFLYYSLGIAIWALIALSVYVALSVVRLLDHVRSITKVAFSTAMNIQLMKSGLKIGVFKFLQNALSAFWEGGVKDGKK